MKKILLVLLLLLSSQAYAAEISVSPGESIQTAINGASDGDTINLAAGVYKESFSFKGKAIMLHGSGKETILKGTNFKTAITFNEDETNDSIVENITFNRGLRAGSIIIDQAAPTIRQCWFYKNKSIGAGNSIFVFGTNSSNQSAVITNNVFYKNKTRSFKPGNIAHTVYVDDSSPTINNNTFVSNDRSGVYVRGLSAPLITSNIFAYMGTIKGPERKKPSNFDEKEKRGRAVYIENLQGGSNVQLTYNISFGQNISDVYIQGTDFSFTALEASPVSFVTTNNNLVVNPGLSGITLNKKSKVKSLSSEALSASSPAINAGNPDEAFNDADSSRNDIGATGGPKPFSFTSLEPLNIKQIKNL
jgi:parallel beta-helix repeat protein